jgi:hypothetical protein
MMKTFQCTFVDTGSTVALQLQNATSETLRSVEILTVFLKDDSTVGGPSQAHIRFDPVNSVRPLENVVVSHSTWIDGKIAAGERDQMSRLQPANGAVKPYVLDISWQEPGGKTCFQRIPVGH